MSQSPSIFDDTDLFFTQSGVSRSDLPTPQRQLPSGQQIFNKFSSDIMVTIRTAQNVLQQSRQNYFSNSAYSSSSFSAEQRQEFDLEIKNMLQNISSRINELTEFVKADERATETQKAHFTGAVACLYQASKKPDSAFRSFLSYNETLKHKLMKLMELGQQNTTKPAVKTRPVSEPAPEPRRQMDPQLEKQGRLLLLKNSDKKDQIMQAQKLLGEINKMLDQTSNKVLQQQFQTSAFMQIGQVGLANVQKGNSNLIQANAYSKQVGKYWIWFFNILTILILLFDYLKS